MMMRRGSWGDSTWVVREQSALIGEYALTHGGPQSTRGTRDGEMGRWGHG